VITIKNTQRKIKVNVPALKRALQKMLASAGYPDFDLGVWLTTNATIRSYNQKYRKIDKPTDILSFPYHPDLKPGQKIVVRDPEDRNLGDLIISLEFAIADAPNWDRSFTEHLHALCAHGIAHLLGYDHGPAMTRVENRLFVRS